MLLELILGLELLLDRELILGRKLLRLDLIPDREPMLRLEPMLRELILRLEPELRDETDREPPPLLEIRPRASNSVVGIAISAAVTMANKYFVFIAHLLGSPKVSSYYIIVRYIVRHVLIPGVKC